MGASIATRSSTNIRSSSSSSQLPSPARAAARQAEPALGRAVQRFEASLQRGLPGHRRARHGRARLALGGAPAGQVHLIADFRADLDQAIDFHGGKVGMHGQPHQRAVARGGRGAKDGAKDAARLQGIAQYERLLLGA